MGRLKFLLIVLLLCFALMPAIIYLVAEPIVGEYEDPLGMVGLYGSIYRDLVTLTPATWFMLTAPTLVLLMWMTIGRVLRISGHSAADEDDSD